MLDKHAKQQFSQQGYYLAERWLDVHDFASFYHQFHVFALCQIQRLFQQSLQLEQMGR